MINLFKKKQKKPLVEFWSSIPGLESIEEIKPKPAANYIPHFFKNMPAYDHNDPIWGRTANMTAKSCPAIIEFMKQGYVIPMWCDTVINLAGEYPTIHTSNDEVFRWHGHNNSQFVDWLPPNTDPFQVIKAVSPWHIRTSKGYSSYQMPMLYNEYEQDFTVAAGVMRSDIWHTINLQIILKKQAIGKEIFIPRGTPLAWYIPFKRESFELDVSPINQEKSMAQHISLAEIQTKFMNAYRKQIKKMDRDEQ